MIEELIKKMLNGIINNGEKWECRPNGYYCSEERKYVDKQCDYDACAHTCRDNCYNEWQPYKLGDEIHADWEYRKVESWCVCKEKNGIYSCGLNEIFRSDAIGIVFEGTKEECEKWIEEHTKKTWYEDYLKLFPKSGQKETCRIVCKEVCKKILEEIRTHEGIEQLTKFYIAEIIKDLGVDL